MSGRWGCRPLWRGGWREQHWKIRLLGLVRSGWPFDCTYKQQDDAQEQHCNDHWQLRRTSSRAQHHSQQKEVCRKALLESVDREIHCGSTARKRILVLRAVMER